MIWIGMFWSFTFRRWTIESVSLNIYDREYVYVYMYMWVTRYSDSSSPSLPPPRLKGFVGIEMETSYSRKHNILSNINTITSSSPRDCENPHTHISSPAYKCPCASIFLPPFLSLPRLASYFPHLFYLSHFLSSSFSFLLSPEKLGMEYANKTRYWSSNWHLWATSVISWDDNRVPKRHLLPLCGESHCQRRFH